MSEVETLKKIAKWQYQSGNTGVSSEAMAAHFCGTSLTRWRASTPSDPADLNRCLNFLKWVPECRDRLHELRMISERWAALVERWDEVEQCFLGEVGLDWEKGKDLLAEKTYALMKEIGL